MKLRILYFLIRLLPKPKSFWQVSILPLLLAPSVAASVDSSLAQVNSAVSPISAIYLIKLVLALVFVLGLFIFLAKLTRHLKGIDHTHAAGLRVLTGISIGSRERLVIVQAGDLQMLLGISPSGIVKLREFDEAIVVQKDENTGESFKARMDKLLDRSR